MKRTPWLGNHIYTYMPYAVLPRRPVIAAGRGAGQGEMAKLSGAEVLLLVVLPLSMYTCCLLLGIQFGRLMEREADNNGSIEFTWRGALDYVTKVMDQSIISSTMIAMAPAIATACSCSSCIISIHQ
jgi:hypothetical protein